MRVNRKWMLPLAFLMLAVIAGSALGAKQYGPDNCAVTVVYIEPLQSGAKESEVSDPVCYETRAEYEETLGQGSGVNSLSEHEIIIGVDHEDSNFGGSE